MAKYEVKLKGLIDGKIYTIDCDTFQKGWKDINFYKYGDAGKKELVASFDKHSVECVVKVGE